MKPSDDAPRNILLFRSAGRGEVRNAIREHGSAGVVGDLFRRLMEWQRQTPDPLMLPDPRPRHRLTPSVNSPWRNVE